MTAINISEDLFQQALAIKVDLTPKTSDRCVLTRHNYHVRARFLMSGICNGD